MALTLLIGGARSGKSALALRRARDFGGPVVFVATAEPRDTEMTERIARHRRERPLGWTTVEAPLDLAGALAAVPPSACAVVDCLSLWVANLLEQDRGEEAIEHAGAEAGRLAAARAAPTIAVTNEVGMGVVPASDLGRRYRDVLGRVNAVWADLASQAALVVAGRALLLEDGGLV
jgi:adenosylcobinamide kinase / adenosylcobinamide-phosphate guanylyltransferase